MTTLEILKNFTEKKGLKLEIEKTYYLTDIVDTKRGLKKIEDCTEKGIAVGFEYKKFNYIWFEADRLSYDIIEGQIDFCKLTFSFYYNQNTGSTTKGFRRAFNFCFKNRLITH